MSEPSPNDQIWQLPNNIYNWDARAAYANGAAGSINPMVLYAMEVREATRNADFWAKFRKANRSSPIVFEKRPSSRGGQKVLLRASGVLGGPGKMGGQLFSAETDFGRIPLHEQGIQLDVISQATGVERHANEMLGLADAIKNQIPAQLGDWGGRFISRHCDMTFLHKSAATSRMWQNSKTTATLKSADTPSWNGVATAAAIMSSNGGSQFKMGVDQNGLDYWNMMFPMPERLARSIKQDNTTQQIYLAAAPREKGDNPFFTGAIPTIDGNTIISRRITNSKGQVPSGSPWAPIAYLGVAQPFVSGGTYGALQGGGYMYNGTTNTPWFSDFPGYPFPWSEYSTLALADSFWGAGDSFNPGSGAVSNCFYALVVNPPNTGTAYSGLVGMIVYTVGANANTLTIVGRLSATNATGSNESVIGAASATGLFAGRFTENFEKGAAIIPCDILGTPIGAYLGVGQDAMGFVRGDLWGDNFSAPVEGGIRGRNQYTGWTFGEEPYIDVDEQTPGVIVVGCAVAYPEYNLPPVT